jgi:hypothetical protein
MVQIIWMLVQLYPTEEWFGLIESEGLKDFIS